MWPITRPGTVQKPDAITVCNKGEGCAKMVTVQDGLGGTFSCLPMSQHGWGMRRAIGHAERSGFSRLVRTLGSMCSAQRPTRPLRMAQQDGPSRAITPDQCGEGVSEPRGCQGAFCAYGSLQSSLPRSQTAPPRAPYPAWARGTGFL